MKIILATEKRSCGDCQLCCKLLPVRELSKGADERCCHQKFKKGCSVYSSSQMPQSCKLWSCRWLTEDDTADLHRPDRSHVVIDIMPDFITAVDNETGKKTVIQVVQVWVDARHRDAWRSQNILAYLDRRGQEGIATLIRFNSEEGFTVFPPSMTQGHGWREMGGQSVPQRSPEEYLRTAMEYEQS